MTAWPAIGYKTYQWTHRDTVASRRSQRRNQGAFEAPLPPAIAYLTPALSSDTFRLAVENTQRMTRFDQRFAHLAEFPFSVVLLRGESATSSQIENLTVRARKLSIAALGGNAGTNAALVARNVEAMRAAINLSENIDERTILYMHDTLTSGILPDAGTFRSEWGLDWRRVSGNSVLCGPALGKYLSSNR